MKQRRQLLTQMTGSMDIETGCVPGIPVVEIAGRDRVLIENHKGIIAYGTSEIQVKVKYGCIAVVGNNLFLSRMTKEQLIVSGSIEAVRLCGRA